MRIYPAFFLLSIFVLVTFSFIGCSQQTFEISLLTANETENTTEEFAVQEVSQTTQLKPASFTVGELMISPEETMVGSKVFVITLISNIGDLSGSYDVRLLIDDIVEDTKEVTLAANTSQKVYFTLMKNTPKSYKVSIDDQTAKFVVNPIPLPPPSSPTLASLDDFMKGIAFSDFPWDRDEPRPPKYGPIYHPPNADASLKQLASTGANWISVMVVVYQETISSTEIFQHQYRTASDESLRHVIEYAHNLGLRVALAPSVFLHDDSKHTWIQIGTSFWNEQQWQDWFTSYREIINHYASLAQESGVDLLYIGSELPGVTHREDDWRRVVEEARDRYEGLMSYDSVNKECTKIKWWDALDIVATDVWYPLTEKKNPTVEELKQAWTQKGYLAQLEKLAGQLDKPFIISEIGYMSADGNNTQPPMFWKYAEYPVDIQEQTDCYEVAFSALWGQPWLKGIFWWVWHANDAYYDTDYSPQEKPAEDVIRRYYGGK